MAGGNKGRNLQDEHILLGLLESVERDGASQSQRGLAADLGIALGLVNLYLKRCVRKGFVKVASAPSHRFAYYLTPQGFAEKSRLTMEYLSYSLGFFREAKTDCAMQLNVARERGLQRLALAGVSDLAEIAVLCAAESSVVISAVVDGKCERVRFLGVPIVRSFDAIDKEADGVLITDLVATADTIAAAVASFDIDKVLIPSLLRARAVKREVAVK
jgi:Winged helix-turn-helix DNA-binding